MFYLKTLSLYCALLFSITISAQNQNNNITIQGKVFNSFNKPIENVNAILQNAKDSSIIKASFTDKNGIYSFENIKANSYQIVFSAISFKTTYSNIFIVDTQWIAIPNIILQPEAKKLSDVVITGNKPPFENKPGKIIMNVDASPTNAGSTALELLNTAPGISISNSNNTISLKGKDGLLILIDGKSTYLSGEDLINSLKNTTSASIDKVEIISNPSAKYDAGNAGVINLITKKGKQFGFNGNNSISYSQGKYPIINNTLNLNYRNNKLNVFGNYLFLHGTYHDNSNDNNNFRDDNGQIVGFSNQLTSSDFTNWNHKMILGLDYSINKKNIIGIKLSERVLNRIGVGNSKNKLGNNVDNINTTLQSNTNSNQHRTDLSNNISYRSILNNKGAELNFDADYAQYKIDINQFLSTQAFDNNNNLGSLFALKRIGKYITDIYASNIDFIHPLNKEIKIETGIKLSYIKSNNISTYYNSQGLTWTKDNIRSNHFIYEENIRAGYINITKEFKNWHTELGFRIENTQMKGNEVNSNTIFIQNYVNFFPNLSIIHHLNNKDELNIRYTKSIKRPPYNNLNPYTYFIDSLNYMQGNPYLKPAFTNNFEINYIHKNITTTLNYSSTTDAITLIYGQKAPLKLVYQTYENLSNLDILGIAVSAPFTVQKYWKSYIYAYLYNTYYKDLIASTTTNKSINAMLLKINNTFLISPSFTVEIAGTYKTKTPGDWALSIAEPYYIIRMGCSKSILRTRGFITLTLQTASYQTAGIIRYSNIDDKYIEQFDERRVGFTFNYRFGKQTVLKAKEHTGSAEEEKSRTGG